MLAALEPLAAWLELELEPPQASRIIAATPAAPPVSPRRRREPPARLDLPQHQLEASPSDLVEVLADRRERGREVRGLGDVVESDHADFTRDVAPRLVHGTEHAQSHVVVAHEDRAHAL